MGRAPRGRRMTRRLKTASFPLPMDYQVPELRFTLRDGARFCEHLQSRGVDATKLLRGDPAVQTPESPLLKLATSAQWIDPEWWRTERYDLVVMYGRPRRAMAAIRQGAPETILCLKMDAGYGVAAEWVPSMSTLARRYVFYRTVQERPALHALARAMATLCRNYWGPQAIVRQKRLFSLPHFILYEHPAALEQTAGWFRRHGLPEWCRKLALIAHPVRDELTCTGNERREPDSMVSIANWTAAYKDARLLEATTHRVFARNATATLRLIGKGSLLLRERILEGCRASPDRIQALEFVHPTEMRQQLVDRQVYLGSSVCESFCIAVAEGLCCGCSAALAPGIGVPSFRYFASGGSGTVAGARSGEALAAAVETEFKRWRAGIHDPPASAARWGERFHTSPLTRKLCDLAGFSLP